MKLLTWEIETEKNTLVLCSLLAAVLKTSPSTRAPQQHTGGSSTAAAAPR